MRRFGPALLWAGGLAIAALMAYTLALDAGFGRAHRPVGHGQDVVEVAVYYPERILWQEFRLGVRLCVRKGLADLVDESEASIAVATPRYKRLIRFDRHDVRGLRETKDEVQRMIARSPPPLAVVGSSNTVLTRALAESLRSAAGPEGGKGPVLLIPWASAVLADRPEPGEGPVSLLDILPGRTFRFCPNNQHQADLIVSCLVQQSAGRLPRRAVLVVDRRDPYSVDLAASFHRAIENAALDAEIIERSESLSLPVPHDSTLLPTPAEDALAESIWRDAEGLPKGRPTWVVLPLQSEPTRRMIFALRRHARLGLRPGDGPIRILCGDGIGYSVLSPLAGRCAVPIWCSSSASAPAAARALGQGISPDTQVPAEIVSALIQNLDLPKDQMCDANRLREGLASLRVDAGSRAAIGRSLAFSPSGERVGDDLGYVLMIRPDRPTVYATSRSPSGHWSEPAPLGPAPVAFRP